MRKSVAHKTSQLSLPLLSHPSLTHLTHFTTHHPHHTFSLPHHPPSLHPQSAISPSSSPNLTSHTNSASLTPTLPASSNQVDHAQTPVCKERRTPATTVLVPFNRNWRHDHSMTTDSGNHGDGTCTSEKDLRRSVDGGRDSVLSHHHFSKKSTLCPHQSESAGEHSQPVSSLVLFNSRVALGCTDQLTAALSPHHPHIACWRKARSRYNHTPSTLVHHHLSQSGRGGAGVSVAMAGGRHTGDNPVEDRGGRKRQSASLELLKEAACNSTLEEGGKSGRGRRRNSDLQSSTADGDGAHLPTSPSLQLPPARSHGRVAAAGSEGSRPCREWGEPWAGGSSHGSSCHQQHHQSMETAGNRAHVIM